jgi:sugar O-acyltransferase (sialic acid O-acetyltransferase NeuD family)
MRILNIIGSGGFAGEVESWACDSEYDQVEYYVSDEYCTWERPLSTLNAEVDTVIAIGDPLTRKKIGDSINTEGQVIHHSAIVDSYNTGMILCPYTVITTDVQIGRHLHMNLHSDIGHDCVIGDYVTLSPGARVSGNCKIGNCVYIGSNAVIREKINVCDNVTIGAGSVVVKDITEPGVYVGVPAKRINREQ